MEPEILFEPSPEKLELTSGEIHVFCAALDFSSSRMDQFSKTLSMEERERAARFLFERHRRWFVAGHGILREILGWLLGVEPRELKFSQGPNGKPRLAAPVAGNYLHFNLAHCDSLAVYATSPARPVGIDLERIRPAFEPEEIVARCFSEREREEWLSLPDGERRKAFFDCWTRKEAVLKASGQGISEGMNQVEVFFSGNLSRKSPWSLRSFSPARDHTAAVAAEDHSAHVNGWKWEGALPG